MKESLAYQEESWEEVINGEVVLMSPRPKVNHSFVASNIYSIFDRYLRGKTCLPFADGVDLYLSEDERYIPDGMIVCDQDKVQENGVHGAPDLVLEVLSPSTVRYDRGHKKDVYERFGVKEYWIVSPGDKTLEQYLLENGKLVLHDVYMSPDDSLIKKMKEQERAQVKKEFKCSLYDDLIISLEDVFYRVK